MLLEKGLNIQLSQEVVEKNQKAEYSSRGNKESSHKIEDCYQHTVESSHDNIHWNQDIDASAQSKICGLDLKGGLDLNLKLGLEHLKVQFVYCNLYVDILIDN